MIQTLEWWVFVTVGPVAYWLSPPRWRMGLLGVGSAVLLLAYAPLEVAPVVVLGLAIYAWFARAPAAAVAATAGAAPAGRRILGHSGIPVAAALLYLFWFKYSTQVFGLFNPASVAERIVVPLGLSYVIFKLVHYAIERGRGTFPPHGLQDFVGWLFLMPAYTAGPIEPFDHFRANIAPKWSIDFLVEGGTRIAQGLVKKFVIASAIGHFSENVTGPELDLFLRSASGLEGALSIWAFLIAALAMLYLDFSAYTDVAVGASRLFGLRIVENFDYPFVATSLTDFWRRWHMSLTNWCRGYVFMPLMGLTRNPSLAIVVTFAVVGLWHAGSLQWLAWGVWHGVGQAAVQRWARFAQKRKIHVFRRGPGKLAGWVLTMAYVTYGGALVAFYPQGTLLDSIGLMIRALGL